MRPKAALSPPRQQSFPLLCPPAPCAVPFRAAAAPSHEGHWGGIQGVRDPLEGMQNHTEGCAVHPTAGAAGQRLQTPGSLEPDDSHIPSPAQEEVHLGMGFPD